MTRRASSKARIAGRRTDRDLERSLIWLVIPAIEVIAASVAVLADLAIPSLVLLTMAVASLAARRQGLASLGLRRFTGWAARG